jgi:hypothetical protein
MLSTKKKNTMVSATMMNTITVVSQVSFQLGQVTSRRLCLRTCRINSPGLTLGHSAKILVSTNTDPRPERSGSMILMSGLRPFRADSPAAQVPVAGVEGLEPPALGFGDRCSTS